MNGENAAPIYKFLKASKGGLFGDSIKWNFSKFLVDKEGNVVDRYAPTTSPLSIEVSYYSFHHIIIFHNSKSRVGFDVLLSLSAEGYKETSRKSMSRLLFDSSEFYYE